MKRGCKANTLADILIQCTVYGETSKCGPAKIWASKLSVFSILTISRFIKLKCMFIEENESTNVDSEGLKHKQRKKYRPRVPHVFNRTADYNTVLDFKSNLD